MGLGQSQQVSLGRQDLPEAVAERRAQVAGLAGLLGDDQDRHGRQPDPNLLVFQPWDGKYPDSTSRRAARVKSRSRRAGRPALSTTRSSRTEGGGPELARIRIDTITGMAFSSLVSLAIVFATAATLHAHGVTDIATSAQAAEALRPIAGEFAFALFAAGIIGTGLLAVPVLAGSAAYAVSEMFGWAGSLDARPNDARAFYATIAVATLLGAALNFVGLDPVRALYWAAVVNGVLAAPLMAVMMMIVRNSRIMGRLTLSRSMAIWGWTATGVMTAASLAFFILP